MTQVSRGNRPGVALPIRIHDLLLGLAGRLDDDALADARQMLASAELDRSLEFIAGCLVAGRVVLTTAQRRDLESLFADTNLDPSVVDRVVARDKVPVARHQFAVGAVEGREPELGVADALRPVLDVLPDVRSVWCVWRLTPAGPVSGPVPHRVVLVGVGPGGFPPATAYRVEYALRRTGIRASVEVLVDGNQPTDYHQEAMRCARQVPFDEPGSGDRPRMSPAEPARSQPFAGDQRHARPVEPRPFAEPAGPSRPGEASDDAQRTLPPPIELSADPRGATSAAELTLPPPIELPRATDPAQHELSPPVEPHHGDLVPDGAPSQGAMPPPRADAAAAVPPPAAGQRPDAGPDGSMPPPVELRRRTDPGLADRALASPVELRRADAELADRALASPVELRRADMELADRALPPPVELPRADMELADRALPPPVELHRTDAGPRGDHSLPSSIESPRAESPRVEPAEPAGPSPVPRPKPEPAESAFAQERQQGEQPRSESDGQPQSALRIETPTNSRPAPRRRPRSKDLTRPRLLPASKDGHSAAFGDDILNTQERNLLRELQDELARREQEDKGSTWSGRHGRPGFDSARASGAPTVVNGVPPYPDGRA